MPGSAPDLQSMLHSNRPLMVGATLHMLTLLAEHAQSQGHRQDQLQYAECAQQQAH